MEAAPRYLDLSSEQRINRLVKHGFYNDRMTLEKSLWRLTKGNRAMAFDIVKDLADRWGIQNLTEIEFDIACAELNGGIEVEWLS